jgi:hypothetical protein
MLNIQMSFSPRTLRYEAMDFLSTLSGGSFAKNHMRTMTTTRGMAKNP